MTLANRLAGSIVLICTVSVAFGLVLLGIHDAGQANDALHSRIVRTASILGPNAAAALAFEDQLGAQAALYTLQSDPDIVAARLYRADGSAFATFHPPDSTIDLPGYANTGGSIDRDDLHAVKLPVDMSGETVGFLLLVGRVAPMASIVRQTAGAAAFILFPVAAVSFLLSFLVRRSVAKPIRTVADCVRSATTHGDLSVRIAKTAGGDLGDLVEECNRLLSHMELHERQLIESRDQLDELVQLRTAEQKTVNHELKRLVHELQEAKKAADTANRTKSQFLARMSHEIRTPMNGVLGMTDLLIQGGLTDRQRGLAETVYRSGEALLCIINDILDFSKIEAGKLDLCLEAFNIRSVMQDVLELTAEPAQTKGLEIVGIVDESVPTTMTGDALRLRQVLINLIGNAVKFTSDGEVVVRCSALHQIKNKVVVKFEVHDTGIGIYPEAIERVFDPFSQADGTTTRKFGGTGLGLAICKQLVLMMGGDIGAESEIGRGSVFWFSACFEDPVREEHPDAHVGSVLASLPVLVSSPNHALCEQIHGVLAGRGADVRIACEVNHAIDCLRAARAVDEPIRVVLVDTADGFDQAVIQTLRAGTDAADTRIIALTPFHGNDGGGRARMKADASVRKPVSESVLCDAVAEVLGGTVTGGARDVPPARPADRGPRLHVDAEVLVAEDNPVNQEVARGMLAQFGCRVTIAVNGVQAVKLARDRSFDIVFMDCQMPEMDGFDATRAIRKLTVPGRPFLADPTDEDGPRLPIVALTANAMQEDRDICLSRGMDDYMSKPFTTEQLAEVLQKWLPHRITTAPEPESREAGLRAGATDEPSRGTDSSPGPPPTAVPVAAGDENDDPVLDRQIINSILGVQQAGAAGLLERVVQSYLTETPKLLDEVRRAAARRDAQRLKVAAHSLKSSSANVGARSLARQCKEIEGLDDEALRNIGSEFAARVESTYEAVRAALRAELEAVAI